jgi:hypothetical protein
VFRLGGAAPGFHDLDSEKQGSMAHLTKYMMSVGGWLGSFAPGFIRGPL